MSKDYLIVKNYVPKRNVCSVMYSSWIHNSGHFMITAKLDTPVCLNKAWECVQYEEQAFGKKHEYMLVLHPSKLLFVDEVPPISTPGWTWQLVPIGLLEICQWYKWWGSQVECCCWSPLWDIILAGWGQCRAIWFIWDCIVQAKMALLVEKKSQVQQWFTTEKWDIVTIVKDAWENSLYWVQNSLKPIAQYGWDPLNFNWLLHPQLCSGWSDDD